MHRDFGKTFNSVGDKKKALEYLEKSLVIAESVYCKNHPKIGDILLEIG